MLPENVTAFEIHAVKLGVVALVAKAADEVIALDKAILENHGEVPIPVNDFRFGLGNVKDGISHVVSRRDVNEITKDLRVGRVDIVGSPPAVFVKDLALGREIVTDHRATVENHRGVLAFMLIEDGSGISGTSGIFGTPDFFTGFLVQGDQRSGFRTWEAEEGLAINHGRGGISPGGHVAAEIVLELDDPFFVTAFGIVAGKTTGFGEIIDEAFVNDRGGSGAAVVEFWRKLLGIVLFPDDIAGLGIKAPEGIAISAVTHGVGATIGHGEAGAAFPDFGLPEDLGALFLNIGRNLPFGGTVPIGAQIGRPGGSPGDDGQTKKQADKFHSGDIIQKRKVAKPALSEALVFPSVLGSE